MKYQTSVPSVKVNKIMSQFFEKRTFFYYYYYSVGNYILLYRTNWNDQEFWTRFYTITVLLYSNKYFFYLYKLCLCLRNFPLKKNLDILKICILSVDFKSFLIIKKTIFNQFFCRLFLEAPLWTPTHSLSLPLRCVIFWHITQLCAENHSKFVFWFLVHLLLLPFYLSVVFLY